MAIDIQIQTPPKPHPLTGVYTYQGAAVVGQVHPWLSVF